MLRDFDTPVCVGLAPVRHERGRVF
jgi:hypothetical protein